MTLKEEFTQRFMINGTFTLNYQRQVWVQGNVVSVQGYHALGFQFMKVTGFMRVNGGLRSLEGLPESVGDNLEIAHNTLVDLQHCSKTVGKDLWITGMTKTLKSLDGFPEHVGGTVHVTFDPQLPMLRTLAANQVKVYKPVFVSQQIHDQMQDLELILRKYCGTGNPADILRCASELNEHGLEGNAEW
jgi:hypothetical protein